MLISDASGKNQRTSLTSRGSLELLQPSMLGAVMRRDDDLFVFDLPREGSQAIF